MAKASLMNASPMKIRAARRDDLRALLALYADDGFGRTREAATSGADYERAFHAIAADANHLPIVGKVDVEIVATLLLSFLPGPSRSGAWRAQIEGKRVSAPLRGRGWGKQRRGWAITKARRRGCELVQLTSDRRRSAAHRFYEDVGFEATHHGFKTTLDIQ
ncbi:GNAT family N-acetyltransferase [Citreimonas salinaria]|uniref:Ribosomal protein S18 acetylase RimI n=1 Tax=Citreimonas salinaria TaxID=321339 RepID=A0A1H3LGT8_9RHOB|nr:GNAT family N-acetyltransferase [Citreimonas salinaria]SDY63682.1 Ribosomal protein S18 acetylase RimI [Citreimonas salinaria]